MDRKKTLTLVQFSILLAIEAIFCFVPILGSIPMPFGMVATLAMIPIIITALLLGTKAGTLMGLFGGIFSLIVWTFMPSLPAVAFVFSPFYSLGDYQGNFGSLLIAIVPRVLVGTVTGLVFSLLNKISPYKKMFNLAVSGVLGSLVNTAGVLGGIWLFFGNEYSSVYNTLLSANETILPILGGMILTNGIPEAVVSAIIAPAVCIPVKSRLS